MGGNALKNCNTVRLDKKEYQVIQDEVLEILCKNLKIFAVAIPSYFKKETYGDLDILVCSESLPTDFISVIQTKFNSRECVKNGNVYSVEYKNFQIDLILTPEKDFNSSYHYFSYNDLGNLMGRIAHKQGIKYGHSGTSYVFRDQVGNTIEEIKITSDFHIFCNAFDFNVDKNYGYGFDTLEDIFEFVSASKFFNPDIYLLDNLNHKSRVRDKKRETYNKFLKWCEEKKNTDWKDRVFYDYSAPKKSYLPRLFDVFTSEPNDPSFYNEPSFYDKWMEAYKRDLQNQEYRKKFNGDIVRSLTSLSGSELGDFIFFFKLKNPRWEFFLASSTSEEIAKRILELFSVYVKTNLIKFG